LWALIPLVTEPIFCYEFRKERRKIEKGRIDFIERNGMFEKATLLPWHSRCQEPPKFYEPITIRMNYSTLFPPFYSFD